MVKQKGLENGRDILQGPISGSVLEEGTEKWGNNE